MPWPQPSRAVASVLGEGLGDSHYAQPFLTKIKPALGMMKGIYATALELEVQAIRQKHFQKDLNTLLCESHWVNYPSKATRVSG